MRTILALTLLLAGLPIAPTMADSKSPCLTRDGIEDYKIGEGRQSLIVTDVHHQVYQVNFRKVCTALTGMDAIRFQDYAKSRLACLTGGDQILNASVVGSQERCTIENVEFYRPAAPARARDGHARG